MEYIWSLRMLLAFMEFMFLKYLGNLWKLKGYWSNVSLENKFQRFGPVDSTVVLRALSGVIKNNAFLSAKQFSFETPI